MMPDNTNSAVGTASLFGREEYYESFSRLVQ